MDIIEEEKEKHYGDIHTGYVDIVIGAKRVHLALVSSDRTPDVQWEGERLVLASLVLDAAETFLPFDAGGHAGSILTMGTLIRSKRKTTQKHS